MSSNRIKCGMFTNILQLNKLQKEEEKSRCIEPMIADPDQVDLLSWDQPALDLYFVH